MVGHVADNQKRRKRWYDLANQYGILSVADEKELIADYQRDHGGQRLVVERLVCHNLFGIIGVAQRKTGVGIDFEDVMMEGVLGLWQALQKFNSNSGVRFISYAAHWVEQRAREHIYRFARVYRVPGHVYGSIYKCNRLISELSQRRVAYYSLEKAATFLGERIKMKRLFHIWQLRDNPVKYLSYVGFRRLSEENPELQIHENADHAVEKTDTRRYIRSLMAHSKDQRESSVILHYFGMNGKDRKTLEEIGNRLSLTRERVRQIREKAVKRLKWKADRDPFFNDLKPTKRKNTRKKLPRSSIGDTNIMSKSMPRRSVGHFCENCGTFLPMKIVGPCPHCEWYEAEEACPICEQQILPDGACIWCGVGQVDPLIRLENEVFGEPVLAFTKRRRKRDRPFHEKLKIYARVLLSLEEFGLGLRVLRNALVDLEVIPRNYTISTLEADLREDHACFTQGMRWYLEPSEAESIKSLSSHLVNGGLVSSSANVLENREHEAMYVEALIRCGMGSIGQESASSDPAEPAGSILNSVLHDFFEE